MNMTRISAACAAVFGLMLSFSSKAETCATPTSNIKVATLAPEGSSLYKGLANWGQRIKTETGGCVVVSILAGGSVGDENDYVMGIRSGRIQAAALTGVGLAQIEPEIRVLELPFLFENTQQIDATYAGLTTYFRDKFSKKGFKLVGWAELGWVQLFTTKPVKSLEDLKALKIWVYPGEIVGQTLYTRLGLKSLVSIPPTDVLTSLQTGLLDACYNTALGAIAMQWHTKVKYVTNINIVNGSGGIVISDKAWAKMTPAQQQLVQKITDEESKKMVADTRSGNQQSLAALKSSGVQVTDIVAADLQKLKDEGMQVHKDLTGKVYPQTLLDKVYELAGKK